jgi:poly(glycerol-phosphate) alpha-glucosyltransferase
LKINVVIDSMSRAAGGLFDAERRLWQSLSVTGIGVSAFSLADEFSVLDASTWLPIVPESFPAGWPGALGRSTPFRSRLLAEPADLLYRAGLWSWPSRNAHEWCRQYDKPEIIAPHGMLDPWAVKNSAWKKKLALFFYEQEHLQNAACLRALCESEARAIRTFGLRNPICIIPNGIDIPAGVTGAGCEASGSDKHKKSEIGNPPWAGHVEPGQKVLLYLGRLHPKKGLANLIRAWNTTINSQPSTNDWLLAIAGWDQGGHEAELKRLATELAIPWADVHAYSELRTPNSELASPPSVLFLGPQFNEAKSACYQHCDAFILPSFSEGLPMVILEAWAYGKPVVMTPECNLPEGFSARAGIRITTDVEGIAHGLTELFGISAQELNALGRNGLRLTEEKFGWRTIARRLRAVCEWLVCGASRPDCVHVD